MVYYLSLFLSKFCFSTKLSPKICKSFQNYTHFSKKKPFKKSFFPYNINVWNNLKADIRNTKSISIFKKLIVSKKHGNSLFSVYDPLGEKFMTRLRLKFSHLKEYKFRHGFADSINSMCVCMRSLS